MAKPALKTDAEESTKPANFLPAPHKKPDADFLLTQTSGPDGWLSRRSFCGLGSLKETKLHTVLPNRGYKNMASLTTTDHGRPSDAQAKTNMIRTAGSATIDSVERVMRSNPKIVLPATSNKPGTVCLFHCFVGFNGHIEPRPDTVSVLPATPSAARAYGIEKITQGEGHAAKQAPIRPRQRDDQNKARKVLKKVPVLRGFKERQRLGEASLDKERIEVKTSLSGLQMRLCRMVDAVVAVLLVFGLVAFCSSSAASTMSRVRDVDIHTSAANHNIDLRACIANDDACVQKSDGATKVPFIDAKQVALSSGQPATWSAFNCCAPDRSGGASERIIIKLDVTNLTPGEMANVVDELQTQIQATAKTKRATNEVSDNANHRRKLTCSVARIACPHDARLPSPTCSA